MTVRFEFDYKQLRELEKKLEKIPSYAERTINDVLHKTGVQIVTENIISRMGVSDKKKKHAKYSKPLTSQNFNLGFEIKPKKPYNYLVFPNNALGTSVGNRAQEFMETGLELSTDDIIQKINREIDKKIEEELA